MEVPTVQINMLNDKWYSLPTPEGSRNEGVSYQAMVSNFKNLPPREEGKKVAALINQIIGLKGICFSGKESILYSKGILVKPSEKNMDSGVIVKYEEVQEVAKVAQELFTILGAPLKKEGLPVSNKFFSHQISTNLGQDLDHDINEGLWLLTKVQIREKYVIGEDEPKITIQKITIQKKDSPKKIIQKK